MPILYDMLEAEYVINDPDDNQAPYDDPREWQTLERGCFRHLAPQLEPVS